MKRDSDQRIESSSNKDAQLAKSQRPAGAVEAEILVVDDDPAVVDLLSEYFRRCGFGVLNASCGEDALSKIRALRVDVALVDLKMPGMDGLETIERITEIDPDTVSILMTGFPTLDSSVHAIKLGASDYILKPFKIDEVGRAIEKAVKERRLRLEMKSLRGRVAELEKGIADKKDNIKVNQKIGMAAMREGHATRRVPTVDTRSLKNSSE